MRLASYAWAVLVCALALSGAQSASAGSIIGCDAGCSATITVNGAPAATGTFLVDPNTGDITLPEQIGVYTSEYQAWIYNIGGNQDPVLLFGLGAVNSGAVPVTFGFAFSLPISMPEPIQAYAEVSYSLTDGAGDGVTLFPTSGTGFVVDSQDIRVSPYLSVDKGVDVGPACALPGSGTCGLYTAGPVTWGSSGGPTYNLMSVLVGFGLTPGDATGMSGKVQQTAVVPEPTTGILGLLGGALAGLAFTRRRQ